MLDERGLERGLSELPRALSDSVAKTGLNADPIHDH